MAERKSAIFSKYNPSGSATTKIKRMADIYVKNGVDETGNVSNSAIYDEAINMLSPYSDDLTVAQKIATYKGDKQKLDNKISRAENSKSNFDISHQNNISKIYQTLYNKNPRILYSKLVEQYGLSIEDYQNNVIGSAQKVLPIGSELPQEITKGLKDLQSKQDKFIDLYNSYVNAKGPTNPIAYGVFIQTNPQTGAIVSMDIDNADSMNTIQKGYTMSEKTYGGIPIYLNTSFDGKNDVARLGNATLKKEASDTGGKILKLDEGSWEGFMKNLSRIYPSVSRETQAEIAPSGSPEEIKKWEAKQKSESTQKIQEEYQKEFPITAVPFDYFDIPINSVVKDVRGNFYYNGSDGSLHKYKDVNSLAESIGKNKQDVENNFYYGQPDFINSKKVIDESQLNNQTTGTSSQMKIPNAQPQQMNKLNLNIPISSGKSGGSTTPSTKQTPEFNQGTGYDTSQIFKKGQEITSGEKYGGIA